MEQDPHSRTNTRSEADKRLARKRHEQWVYRRATESKAGLLTSMLLAQWTIGFAAETETNPEVRRVRKHLMLQRWRKYMGDLIHAPYLGL